MTVTVERLKQLLSYDPTNGHFIWLERRGPIAAGGIAGGKNLEGYINIKIDGVLYKASRLAFLYMIGRWPDKEHVDHINGILDDNRWENLREATRSQNQANRRTVNKNGILKGVFRKGNSYRVHIAKDLHRYHLGCATSEEEAKELYHAAAILLFGEFSRPGNLAISDAAFKRAKEALERKKRPVQITVRRIDDGKIFDSMTAAATFQKTSVQNLRASILRNGKCNGFRFEII